MKFGIDRLLTEPELRALRHEIEALRASSKP